MKRKLLLIIMALLCVITGLFSLTACGENSNNLDAFHEHNLIHVDVVYPTCTVDGEIKHWTCSTCNKNFSDELGTIEVKTVTIPAMGHTTIKTAAVQATCTENGNIEYYTCWTCNKKFSNRNCTTEVETVITSATGHSYSSEWTADDENHWHAATCEHTEQKKDEASHTLVNGVCSVCKNKQPTQGLNFKLADGESYYCSDIGTATDKDIVIPQAFNKKPVTSIGDYAFALCHSLTSITIPNSVTSIGDDAFSTCIRLTSITIPNNVTSIGKEAFAGCLSLASITIPNSVTSIGKEAFAYCGGGLIIYCEATSKPSGWDSEWSGSDCLVVWNCKNNGVADDGNIYTVVDGIRYALKEGIAIVAKQPSISGPITISGAITIPETVTYKNDVHIVASIGSYAFNDCSRLTSITIPNSVAWINDNAFYGCSGLTIYCEATSKPSGWDSKWNYNNMSDSSYYPVVWDCKNNEVAENGNIYTIIDGIRYALKEGEATVTRQPISISGAITIPETVTYKNNTYSVTSIDYEAFAIGTETLYSYNSLTSITIPNSVTSIGKNAFYGCRSLTIYCEATSKPSGWDSSWNYNNMSDYYPVIWDCKNNEVAENGNIYTIIDGVRYALKEGKATVAEQPASISGAITIPETVTYKNNAYSVTTIGNYAFENCYSLTSITIPDSVTSIGNIAFIYCISLTSVTIGNSVTSIGDHTFDGCYDLTSITIGNGVTSIGDGAFNDCSRLTSIIIPDSVKSIGSSAFSMCVRLTSIKIGNRVKTISDYAFVGCGSLTSLTSITIPDSVTSIGESAFSGCSSLTSITIPDSVKSIGSSAFSGCSSLTSITIPNSVTYIGDNTFENCISLTIYCEATSKPIDWDSNWNKSGCPVVWNCKNNDVANNGNIYTVVDGIRYALKDGKVTVVRQPSSTSGLITIPETVTYKNNTYSVTSIDDNAFENCSMLTSITIPDSAISIGENAFFGCSKLQYNEYDNAKYLGNNTNPYVVLIEAKDKNITSCVVHENTKIIYRKAFSGCSSLTSITIPDSVISIDVYAFKNCSRLTSVTIPNSVTSIGSSAFYYCSSLTSVTIPNSVTSIGSSAFSYCSSLASITIPDSVTSIGSDAFSYCSSLASITIPDSVTSIGSRAFSYCSSLTSITIPDSVTSIGSNAFSGCSSLESLMVSIGNSKYYSANNCIIETTTKTLIAGCKNSIIPTDGSVTSIDKGAFTSCSSLTSITIPNSVTSIGDCAFSGCSSLASITIPNSITSIGNKAFEYCISLTSITIPNSVTSIYWETFSGCISLTSITIPNSVTSIGDCAFSGCSSLASITIPNSITSIGNKAFYNCSSLTSITIPNSVTSIYWETFSGCISLTSITIPNSVTSIGDNAFEYCISLTSITIPNSVTSIGNYAFSYCRSLTSITFNGTKAQWNEIKKDSDWNYGKYTIHCTDGDIAKE